MLTQGGTNQLADNPVDAVAAILTGRMASGALQQGDADEFFVAALAYAQTKRQQVADLLDKGLLAWLTDQRQLTPASIAEYGASALISQLERAFITVARLRPARTAQALSDDHLAWEEWLTPLRRRDWIDVIDAFDEALAMNQSDARHSPRWFGRLADAGWGGPAWRSSLRIGLVGLRKLPHPPGTQPESRVAAGVVHFVRHARTRRTITEIDVSSIFQREAAALVEIYYPRSLEHWQDVWRACLNQVWHVSIGKERLRVWLHERLVFLGLAASELSSTPSAKAVDLSAQKQRVPRRTIVPLNRPTKEEREALFQRLKSKGFSSALWKDIRSYVDRDWRFAEGTGDGFSVVLGVANFGHRLLRASMPQYAVLMLRDWILKALSFAPEDPYLWDLWAKVHHALGRYEDALAVLWETVRRFPDNPVVRNRLAKVLRSQGRMVLAESVLRDTMRDFPRDVFCCNMLAKLWRETERAPDAEQHLHTMMREFPRDVVCRNELADLWFNAGRLDEAEGLLNKIIENRMANSITFVLLAGCKVWRAKPALYGGGRGAAVAKRGEIRSKRRLGSIHTIQ